MKTENLLDRIAVNPELEKEDVQAVLIYASELVNEEQTFAVN